MRFDVKFERYSIERQLRFHTYRTATTVGTGTVLILCYFGISSPNNLPVKYYIILHNMYEYKVSTKMHTYVHTYIHTFIYTYIYWDWDHTLEWLMSHVYIYYNNYSILYSTDGCSHIHVYSSIEFYISIHSYYIMSIISKMN